LKKRNSRGNYSTSFEALQVNPSWDQALSYIDAHLHLADPVYAGSAKSIIEDAARANVTSLLSSAVNYSTSVQTISLAKQYHGSVLAAVGIHPSTVVYETDYELALFEHLIDENREYVKAIGEIGLDGKYTQDATKTRQQREIFRFFLSIAEKRQLPVVVHSRLAVTDVLDELSRFNLRRVLMHWYDGPLEKLELIRQQGYMISIGPTLLYSKRIAEIARNADLSTVLTETDGPVPYHGPYEGKRTVPSFVIDIVRKLAELKLKKYQDVRDAVWNNFHYLLQAR
jgi:TatD DNase family protein